MALSNDKQYSHAGRKVETYRVTNGVQVYAGSLVGINNTTGLLVKWSDLAANKFLGVALRKVLGDTSATEPPEADVDCSGTILKKVDVTGMSAIDDVGDEVHATDDNTMTLTPGANAAAIGVVTRWYSGTLCDVRLYTPAEYRARAQA